METMNEGVLVRLLALPPITGGDAEQVVAAESIRERAIPEFEGAARLHTEKIANTFSDATAHGIAEMTLAAVAGIAEVAG